jgi:hypothetical protein
MDLTGRVWAHILQPEKKNLCPSQPEMLFLAILHYKIRHAARVRPENLRPDASSGTVTARIFSTRNNRVFSVRPEPGSARKVLTSNAHVELEFVGLVVKSMLLLIS